MSLDDDPLVAEEQLRNAGHVLGGSSAAASSSAAPSAALAAAAAAPNADAHRAMFEDAAQNTDEMDYGEGDYVSMGRALRAARDNANP